MGRLKFCAKIVILGKFQTIFKSLNFSVVFASLFLRKNKPQVSKKQRLESKEKPCQNKAVRCLQKFEDRI